MRYSNSNFSKEMTNIFHSKELENNQGLLFLFTSCEIGSDNKKLGSILMKKYLYQLSEFDIIPKSIILINSAVLLAANNTEIEIYLKRLKDKGTEILICEISVEYFEINKNILIGNLVNLKTILERQSLAEKIIKL